MNNTPNKTFFGHPLGLLNIFSTEFCERFSYYGMRAILVFYIYAEIAKGGLGLSKQDALFAMTLFGSSVYLLSVIGGWLADRIFSAYHTVFYGGIIIALGHIVLSLPFGGPVGTFIALALIALGTGLLKPNVSKMVGDLYDEGDRKRQAGFNLFVMGINLGSLFAPLIVGAVAEVASYHVAFSIPAVFMFIGLIVYRGLSKKTLADTPKTPQHPLKANEASRIVLFVIGIAVLSTILIIVLALSNNLTLDNFGIILPVVSITIVVVMFTLMIKDKSLEKVERGRVIGYIAVFIVATIFWAIEELQASVFAVLAEGRADNHIGSFEVPAPWYQSINPVVIVILAPLLAILWTKWQKQPGRYVKLAFGIALTAISFIIPGIAFSSVDEGSAISPLFLIIPIVIFSTAELFVSPVGLSMTTELAPKKYASRLMALWFLSNTVGQGINSFAVRFFNEDNPSGFFYSYAGVAIAVTVLVIVLLKPIKKITGGIF